jgi:hypothetical protein
MKLSEFVALYKPEIHLENIQREILDRLEQLDFAEIEKRILASQIREPGKSRFNELVLGVDFGDCGDLTSVCIGRKVWEENGQIKMMIIDDIYTERPVLQTPFRNPGCIDELIRLESFRFIEPEVQEEPEPMAGKHKPSPRTKETKKPLPFYQGKRRF